MKNHIFDNGKKREQNAIILKIKYNCDWSKIIIKQSNTGDRIILLADLDVSMVDYISRLLDSHYSVKSYNLIIDNTQDEFREIVVHTKGAIIPDFVGTWKRIMK